MSARHKNPVAMAARPARIEDAPRVTELLRQLGYDRSTDAVGRSIQDAMANPDSTILVAGVAGEHLVGCLQMVVTRRLAEGDRAEITSMVVDAAWRSRGIGAGLIQAAVERLQAQGIRNLRVRCNTKRERAHQFYQQFGFQRTKSQKVFDLPLSTAAASPDSD